jgi:hypothetical protein
MRYLHRADDAHDAGLRRNASQRRKTRQNLSIHPAWSIRAVDVITVVEAGIVRYGMPEHLRSDNGPELIACCIQDWMKAQEIKTLYIKPGSPWKTGILKAFATSCAMNALTANSSAVCTRTPNEYTGARPTDLTGLRAPKPRAARRGRRSGGTQWQRPNVASKQKPKHQGTRGTSVMKCLNSEVRPFR